MSAVERLAFTPPLDWRSLTRFLAARAIPEIESVSPEGGYQRTVSIAGGSGTLAASLAADERHLELRIDSLPGGAREQAAERARRLFDLDADPVVIGAHLARDRDLAGLVAAAPGLRVPGAWDPFELGVRAILGQQVTVRGAATLGSRLVRAYGRRLAGSEAGPSFLFPEPGRLAEADLSEVGLTRARAATVRGLAAAVAEERIDLSGADPRAVRAALVELSGIGEWTAQYVTLRTGDRDAFPASDLALLKAAGAEGKPPTARELEARAEAWRPWRAYAAMHFWRRYSLR